jgi:hypothetical protein
MINPLKIFSSKEKEFKIFKSKCYFYRPSVCRDCDHRENLKNNCSRKECPFNKK